MLAQVLDSCIYAENQALPEPSLLLHKITAARGQLLYFVPSGTELFNQDNIRIISKGILGHEDEYDSNLYLALLIENGTDEVFDVSVQNDSLSVNDIMISEFSSDTNILPHTYGVLIVELYGSDLEDSNITEVDQIQKVECVIEFGEGYDVAVEAPIVAEF